MFDVLLGKKKLVQKIIRTQKNFHYLCFHQVSESVSRESFVRRYRILIIFDCPSESNCCLYWGWGVCFGVCEII